MSRFSGTDINCSMKRQARCDDDDAGCRRDGGKRERKEGTDESVVAEAGSQRLSRWFEYKLVSQ